MAYERALVRDTAFSDIDEVIHDAVLEAEQQVEVAQARIRIDENDVLAAHRKTHTEICRGRRLTDAAFA